MNLSLNQLKRAVQLKEQMTKLESDFSSLFRSNGSLAKTASGSALSAAAKARLSALAKARWAKIKAGNKPTPPAQKAAAPVPKKSPTMSVANRARLSALMKARWAAKNSGGNKPASAPKKISTVSLGTRQKLSATPPKSRPAFRAARPARRAKGGERPFRFPRRCSWLRGYRGKNDVPEQSHAASSATPFATSSTSPGTLRFSARPS